MADLLGDVRCFLRFGILQRHSDGRHSILLLVEGTERKFVELKCTAQFTNSFRFAISVYLLRVVHVADDEQWIDCCLSSHHSSVFPEASIDCRCSHRQITRYRQRLCGGRLEEIQIRKPTTNPFDLVVCHREH